MSALGRLDELLYRVERFIVAWSMVVMGVVVALDVVYHNATREDGLVVKNLGRFMDPAAAEAASPYVAGVLGLLFFYAVFRTRGSASGMALGLAVVAVGVFVGLVKLYVHLLPNGVIWAQRLGLILMTLAGFVGASLAARERRHLGLEVGPKLFPEAARGFVVAIGHIMTAAFCLWLGYLAIGGLREHYQDRLETNMTGAAFTELPIPYWLAYTPIAYALIVMGLRFLAEAIASARGQDTSEDEVATFKRLGGVDDGGKG